MTITFYSACQLVDFLLDSFDGTQIALEAVSSPQISPANIVDLVTVVIVADELRDDILSRILSTFHLVNKPKC